MKRRIGLICCSVLALLSTGCKYSMLWNDPETTMNLVRTQFDVMSGFVTQAGGLLLGYANFAGEMYGRITQLTM